MKKRVKGLALLLAVFAAVYTGVYAQGKTMKQSELGISRVVLSGPNQGMHGFVVRQAHHMADAGARIAGDKNDALGNPIRAIIKLRASGGRWQDKTGLHDIADKGVAPVYFMPLAPGKQTLPNRLYYQAMPGAALYFTTYEAADMVLPLAGTLHCTFDLAGGGFDYGQVLLGNLAAKDMKTVLTKICANLKILL